MAVTRWRNERMTQHPAGNAAGADHSERWVKAKETSSKSKLQKRHLVQNSAEKLRDVILEREPGAHLGSLTEVAQLLGVGIVTVQQAARVLEHEGLLEVRRGPGGGYYGMRPDDAALARFVAAYTRMHGFSYHEVLDMTTLLDSEIVPAAAGCDNEEMHAALRKLAKRIDGCDTPEDRVAFEGDLHDVLFKFVERPLVGLLARVTSQLARSELPIFQGAEGTAAWKTGRQRIVNAILQRDEELARFEVQRYRQQLLLRLHNNNPAP